MNTEKSLFHHTSIPFAVIDQEKSFVDFSKQWLNTFGLDASIIGQNFFDSMPELPEELKLDINYCLEGIKHRSDSKRIVQENGNAVWYDWKVSLLNDDQNIAPNALIILEDVTHKRREEHLLEKSQQVARIGGWEIDLIKNTIYWSNMTKEIHEVPREYVPQLETGISFYKEGYSRDTITQLVNEGIELGNKWDTELQIVTAKGNILWVRAIGEPEMLNGKCVRIVGTFQDIDKRKKAQLQLLNTEESLKGTLENSSIGMALVARNGKFMDVNTSLCNSLGYTKDKLLSLTFQDITHPEDLEIDLRLLSELIKGKRSTYQIEKRYFNKDQQLVYVILTVTAARNIDGEISHFISQIVDISSRIKAEKKLKGLLELTTNQNNSLMNFAHIVSHNLRSHAANLTMISEFLTDESLDEDIRKDSLVMLGKASQGLNDTISHLNEVVQVKLETDQKLKSVQLRPLVHKVLVDIQALIEENKVIIDTDVPENIQVRGVMAYLESIILNLVTNAIKYKDLNKKTSLVSIKAVEKDETVVLSVSDNGLGIDLDKFGEKLFGMYKTFHGNEDARGIGLFITKNQIESMGGRITVSSQPGVGTTFEVTLLKNQQS
ncbi:sensor histidine kinase [Allomuricauda sp. M10]|uniref:PAS domain-containing sensor histidine kinase n=1 Tax=Allomuricauda sp. M10 TaxID=2683292 RepID=UPI001D18F3C0|nr:HAMP domain-containing sensor histidine kinase [Muricauda sp. M10]